MSAGARTEFDLVEDFWRELVAVDDRITARARGREARRRLRRTLVLAILAILGLAALAFAASRLLEGDDAPRVFPRPAEIESVGPPTPGTVELLPTRTDDPEAGAGAPPWGLRVFYTEAGSVCLQAGRVVGGKLVALGIAGAFGNDGLAHPLPVEAEGCAPAPEGRRVRLTAISVLDASALAGHEPASEADARTVAYGTTPRGVIEVILDTDAERVTQRIDDPVLGTYLFGAALRAPRTRRRVRRYRDGLVCKLVLGGPGDATPSEECLRRRAELNPVM